MTAGSPLKVLHVTYDMRIGGTEQVIRNLIEASDPQQLAMSIFCIEEPLGPWGEMLRAAGTAIGSVARRPGFDTGVVRALRAHIREQAIDVVHCHQYTPWAYGALAALGLKTRIIFTEHGRFYPDSASPKRRFINPLLARITDEITAISRATRQALVDYEYLDADRIRVIYNGIDGLSPNTDAVRALKTELAIPEYAPVLGTIARFDPIKNHRMMLDAFRQVLEQFPEARLLLVGDGEERANIEQQITALGISDRVILPGYIPEPAAWLEAMDVFLLSSFSEGTSMTLLEAMSLGKPSVVTDVGGNPEIVADGETGYVTQSDNAAAFAHAAAGLIAQPNTYATISSVACKRWQERFSAATMAEEYRGIYQARRSR